MKTSELIGNLMQATLWLFVALGIITLQTLGWIMFGIAVLILLTIFLTGWAKAVEAGRQ